MTWETREPTCQVTLKAIRDLGMWLIWWGVTRFLLEAPRAAVPCTPNTVAHTCSSSIWEVEMGGGGQEF